MSTNLENSAVATELEKVNFYSNPKEGQCQRMFGDMDSLRQFWQQTIRQFAIHGEGLCLYNLP